MSAPPIVLVTGEGGGDRRSRAAAGAARDAARPEPRRARTRRGWLDRRAAPSSRPPAAARSGPGRGRDDPGAAWKVTLGSVRSVGVASPHGTSRLAWTRRKRPVGRAVDHSRNRRWRPAERTTRSAAASALAEHDDHGARTARVGDRAGRSNSPNSISSGPRSPFSGQSPRAAARGSAPLLRSTTRPPCSPKHENAARQHPSIAESLGSEITTFGVDSLFVVLISHSCDHRPRRRRGRHPPAIAASGASDTAKLHSHLWSSTGATACRFRAHHAR